MGLNAVNSVLSSLSLSPAGAYRPRLKITRVFSSHCNPIFYLFRSTNSNDIIIYHMPLPQQVVVCSVPVLSAVVDKIELETLRDPNVLDDAKP